MRTKVTLVLLFLNVVLFYYIFYIDNRIVEAADTHRIVGAEAANIQSLVITTAETEVHLRRQAETWHITKPIAWPANEFAVKRILNELQYGLIPESTFEVANIAKTGQSLADFGLEKPALTLSFTPAPTEAVPSPAEVHLKIGNATERSNRLFILSPDGLRIHVVKRSLAESLTVNFDDLRNPAIFSIPVFQARSLTIESASSARLRIRRENERWNLDLLLQARANKTDTEIALSQLGRLVVKSFPDQRNTPGTGLTTPTFRLTLEGHNRTETLILGARLETAAKPTEGEEPATEFYAVTGEEKTENSTLFIVAVPDALLATLKNAQRDLRERLILDFDPSAITSLSLSTSQQSPVTLHRLESSSPATASWQLIRRASGNAPQTTPADRLVVERLLKDFALLRALEFENDAPSGAELENYGFTRPAREITLTSPAGSVTLQLGQGSNQHVYARVTSQSQNYIYRVSPEILPHTPLSPLHYRDRIVRDLPAGARITSIRLTDTASGALLLDTSLPAASPTPNAPKIEALIAQLRTLRAASFLAEQYTEKILSSGEERAWKYRLDLTLELEGASADRAASSTLFISERLSGTTQYLGSQEHNIVFAAEHAFIDALFAFTHGPRDPGPAQ